MRNVRWAGGLVLALLAACDDGGGSAGSTIGPDMNQVTPGNGGSTTVTGGGSTGGGSSSSGGRCNDVSLGQASYINDVRGGTVPPMSGGTIADGTYVVTKYEWHNPINALHTRKAVMVIAGGRVQWASHRDAEKEDRGTATFSTSGERISFQATCGDEPLPWDRFTVSGSWLILHDDADMKTATFTRQ